MGLKKVANDIDFLDPITLKKVCSLNQCIHKFVPCSDVQVRPREKRKYDNFFHQCSECLRKVSNLQDKRETKKSSFNAMLGDKV
jgi:hypothetical protein